MDDDKQQDSSTSPPSGRPETATEPPSNPAPDEGKVIEQQEKLKRASGNEDA
jgi:hypothetical protein